MHEYVINWIKFLFLLSSVVTGLSIKIKSAKFVFMDCFWLHVGLTWGRESDITIDVFSNYI